MNTKLLRAVAKRILKYPEKYDQQTICGTECCMAGHAYLLKHRRFTKNQMLECLYFDSREILDKGAEILGIKPDNNLLNYARHWPEPFATQYAKAKSAKGRARVGYRRIMAFIKSKGKI